MKESQDIESATTAMASEYAPFRSEIDLLIGFCTARSLTARLVDTIDSFGLFSFTSIMLHAFLIFGN